MSATHSSTPIADLALDYAAQGWPVFPCNPATKQPYTPNGFKDASVDPARIRTWWTEHPAAMIGVPTGTKSNVWVLDIDNKPGKDGIGALASLQATHGTLPETVTCRTPSGGSHFYFKCGGVEIRNRGDVEPGIDVRGEGGYVIAPGSVRADGCIYEWTDQPDDLADAPPWLLERVVKRATAKVSSPARASDPSSAYVDAAVSDELKKLVGTSAGRNNQLNDSAFAIGTFVGADAMSRSQAETRLFGAALANGYTDQDGASATRATIKSGLDAGILKPRDLPVPKVQRSLLMPTAANDNAAGSTFPPGSSLPFKLEMYGDIDPNIRKVWIVDEFLGEGEFSAWYGPPGVGKSVLVGDLACHVAAGWDWFGHKVHGGPVLYIAAERAMVVKRRFAAFRQEHEGAADDLPIGIVSGYIDLCSDTDHARALIEMIREFEANVRAPPVLVVVDTIARTLAGGDENGAKEMGSFIGSTGLIQSATNAHILAIHHPPIAGPARLRGHSSLLGALDTTVLVQKKAATRTAIVQKQNDGEEGISIHFDLKPVELFIDAEGATTAPVVVPLSGGAAPFAQDEKRPPRGKRKIVLKALRDAISKCGTTAPDGTPGVDDGTLLVDRETWRKQYYVEVFEDQIGDKDTARKAFDRGVNSLLESKHVGRLAEHFWPI